MKLFIFFLFFFRSWVVFGKTESETFPSNLQELEDVDALNRFEQEIQEGSAVALVFFFAEWCGTCQKVWPDFVQVAKNLDKSQKNVLFHSPQTKQVRFAAMDADKNKLALDQKEGFAISGYPTLYYYEYISFLHIQLIVHLRADQEKLH